MTDASLPPSSPNPSPETPVQDIQVATHEATPDTAPESGSSIDVKLLQEQYLRLAADFDNFRKRSQAEKDQARRYGTETVIQQLLPVLDNLDRASASLNEQSDPKFLYQSFRMIYTQLLEGLSGVGLKKLAVMGEAFDPAFHEAVTQTETDEHPENTVVKELQSGFSLMHQGEEKVLRPAMVSVSSVPAAAHSDETSLKGANPFSGKLGVTSTANPQTATGV